VSAESERRARAANEAAEWFLALQSNEMSARAREEFTKWLRESPLHIAELLRVAQVHGSLESFSRWNEVRPAPDPKQLQADNVVPLTPGADIPKARDRAIPWGRLSVAAAAAGLAVLGLLLVKERSGAFSTRVGEKQEVTLEDGSKVTLAPNSRIHVHFNSDSRVIDLDRGEAFFQVHADPRRAFWVDAGRARTRAIGTSFNVQRRPDKVVVTVVDGRVAVDRSVGTADVSLGVNEQVSITEASTSLEVSPVRKVDGKVETAWLQGALIFDGDTVSEVVQQFNTYNRVQIRVVDPALASRQVSAVFQATDPESFVAFLQGAGGVTVHRRNPNEILIGGSTREVSSTPTP
jgi:transmembrane sensor